MTARGNASQKQVALLSAAALTGSPSAELDVASFRNARICVNFTYGAATSVDMEVAALLASDPGNEYEDSTGTTYSEAVTASKKFFWDVPANCSKLKLTFSGGGTPTTDAVTVHASVTD